MVGDRLKTSCIHKHTIKEMKWTVASDAFSYSSFATIFVNLAANCKLFIGLIFSCNDQKQLLVLEELSARLVSLPRIGQG